MVYLQKHEYFNLYNTQPHNILKSCMYVKIVKQVSSTSSGFKSVNFLHMKDACNMMQYESITKLKYNMAAKTKFFLWTAE